jgi:hypothetical protein
MGWNTNGYRVEPRSSLATDIPEPQLTKLLSECPEAPEGFNQAKSSHLFPFTLLAACGKRETAHESCAPDWVWGGDFTNALIEALNTLPLDELSYSALHKSLCKPPYQNPEFVGVTNCIIFTLDKAKDDGLYLDITAREDGRYTVQNAGIALGIGFGTRFKILTPSYQVLGSLVVEDVEAFQCQACAELEENQSGIIPDRSRAVLHSWCPYGGPLRVALGDGVKRPRKSDDGTAHFQVVEHPEADVVIAMRENILEIRKRDPLIPATTGLPVITYPEKGSPNFLEGTLSGIAHFNYHLFRKSNSSLSEAVTVELYRLRRGTMAGFGQNPINLPISS